MEGDIREQGVCQHRGEPMAGMLGSEQKVGGSHKALNCLWIEGSYYVQTTRS